MPGFDNTILYADNVDFSGKSPVAPRMVQNGQLLIGRSTPNSGGTLIDVNTLTPGPGISISNTPGNITISANSTNITFEEDSGTAQQAGGTLKIFGAGTVTTSGSGNIVTITGVAGSSFTWNVVTSADNPVTLTKDNGYIAKGAGVVDFILPAAAAIGDTFKIIGYGNLWTIAQNANQFIKVGIAVSTTGVGGSVSATTVTDCLDIICVTTNLEFFCNVVQGNPNLI